MERRRPIQPRIDAGGQPAGAPGSAADRFREALARWATTVTIVAARDTAGGVHATTATSFAPVSAEPPVVVVCLGPGAQVLPHAEVGDRVGVSLLHEDQSRWASIYADPFPVDSPAWTEGTPLVPGSVAGLRCTVEEVHPVAGGSRILVCRVEEAEVGESDGPLLYWQRGYRKLDLG
ncbi:MAG TPA: flavin reductase family protein [Longimicrobiales bacterium]|nr:flavin reductase family protein [Longimicrobiales bacterium]